MMGERKKKRGDEGGRCTNMHCRFGCAHVDGTRMYVHAHTYTPGEASKSH